MPTCTVEPGRDLMRQWSMSKDVHRPIAVAKDQVSSLRLPEDPQRIRRHDGADTVAFCSGTGKLIYRYKPIGSVQQVLEMDLRSGGRRN